MHDGFSRHDATWARKPSKPRACGLRLDSFGRCRGRDLQASNDEAGMHVSSLVSKTRFDASGILPRVSISGTAYGAYEADQSWMRVSKEEREGREEYQWND